MSLRIPLRNAKQIVDTSLTGTVNNIVTLDQDVDSVVVKLFAGTFSGTSPTADVYVQTSDDGGTTWYDCAHFAQITTAITAANALWATIPVQGTAAVTNGYTGAAAAASISASRVSGLPVLSQIIRVSIVYGGTVGTNAGITVNVYESNQASNQ